MDFEAVTTAVAYAFGVGTHVHVVPFKFVIVE